jgi:hypothetical protein
LRRLTAKTIQDRYAAYFSPFPNPSLPSPPAPRLWLVGAYLSCSKPAKLETPRLRNFDTDLPSSYCYELQPEHR